MKITLDLIMNFMCSTPSLYISEVRKRPVRIEYCAHKRRYTVQCVCCTSKYRYQCNNYKSCGHQKYSNTNLEYKSWIRVVIFIAHFIPCTQHNPTQCDRRTHPLLQLSSLAPLATKASSSSSPEADMTKLGISLMMPGKACACVCVQVMARISLLLLLWFYFEWRTAPVLCSLE